MDEELLQWGDFFSRTAEKEGPHFALFYTCVSANVPFVIADLPEKITTGEGTWEAYIRKLTEEGDDKIGARDAEWLDGVTDIRKVFGRTLSQKDFGEAIKAEKARLSKLVGTKTQRERWGTMGGGDPLTEQDYERMDGLLDAYASDYRGGGGLTQRRTQALIRYVKEVFLGEKASGKGESKAAMDHYKAADMILAAEAMRAKDEKPLEGFRFDACIAALEKAGLMEEGHFLNYEDTCRAIWNVVHPEGNPRYGFSLDVADQILLNWENNMRKNSAQAEVFELPADMKTYDDYGEFESEETEEEKALKKQMDLSKVRFSKVK